MIFEARWSSYRDLRPVAINTKVEQLVLGDGSSGTTAQKFNLEFGISSRLMVQPFTYLQRHPPLNAP